MKSPLLEAWASVDKPVIGMLHLLPLPGSPRYGGALDVLRAFVVRDAEALVAGGVHGLLVENFGDHPFYPNRVPAPTATHMTALAGEIRRLFHLPLGINVLRNDGRTALAVAHAAGGQFIRVNVLGGARVTDQGLLQGIAHDLLRERSELKGENIKILADVNVKHSAALGELSLEDEVADLIERAGADAVIVSGPGTGKIAAVEELATVKAAAGDAPVLVGSGVSLQSIDAYLSLADGFIIGSYFKVDGKVRNPVDPARVRGLMERLR